MSSESDKNSPLWVESDLCSQRNGRCASAGFTLVEVLASTVVLMLLVLMLSSVFQQSTRAWNLGTRRVQDNMMARAGLDFIARELSQAVADNNLSFRLNSYDNKVFSNPSGADWADWWNDSLSFVTLANDPNDGAPRAAREVTYYVTNMLDNAGDSMPGRYCVRRSVRTAAITCYDDQYWFKKPRVFPEILLENIGSFEVWCVGATTNAAGELAHRNVPQYNSLSDPLLMGRPPPAGGQEPEPELRPFQKDKLPVWIDLYISILEEDAAIKAQALYEAARYDDVRKFVDQNARRYAIRVHMENRSGYGGMR